MPNGHKKEYGGHKYADYDETSDCVYKCGCWMGPTNSGGPLGLDPGGTCPYNPKDKKYIGGDGDYHYVVKERIESLSSRLYKAEDRLKQVSPTKVKLADELASTKTELTKKNMLLAELRRIINE